MRGYFRLSSRAATVGLYAYICYGLFPGWTDVACYLAGNAISFRAAERQGRMPFRPRDLVLPTDSGWRQCLCDRMGMASWTIHLSSPRLHCKQCGSHPIIFHRPGEEWTESLLLLLLGRGNDMFVRGRSQCK